MKSSKCAIAGMFALVSIAGAGETVIAEYNIHDHPQGGLVPPIYALRLDNIFGSPKATFSANTYNDATLAIVQDDTTNDIYIDIQGTFHGGEDLGGAWGTTFDLAVNFRYAANVVATANGWDVTGFSTLNTGMITRLDTMEDMTWYGMEDAAGDNGPVGNAFRFASDGWNIDNDNDSWVGRGWLTMNDDGSMTAPPAQDWIFTATAVPSPAGLSLLGFAGLAATRRRRA